MADQIMIFAINQAVNKNCKSFRIATKITRFNLVVDFAESGAYVVKLALLVHFLSGFSDAWDF